MLTINRSILISPACKVNFKIIFEFSLQNLLTWLSVHTNVSHRILPLRRWGGGKEFYWAWGTLNFHLSLGGLSQMGGLKLSTFFWGDNRVFSPWGMEGVPHPPLAKNYSSFPPGKVSTVNSPNYQTSIQISAIKLSAI